MEIDIVPCYEVASPKEMRSAVDRTPFHVRYLDENLPKDSVDEVRLLKHFLAVHGLYGADAKTQGFSGYLCELLILHYGEFLKALEAAIEWQPGQVVDIEGYYSRDDWPRLRKKFREPLIVIDPIDSNRNVASAVSPMSFFRFKELASNFLARPSMDFFYQKRPIGLGVKELRQILAQRKTELLLIRFKPPRVVPDILWPQLRRFAKRLKGILEEVRYEFKVFGWDVWTDDRELAVVLLEMEIASLPSVQKRIGPPIFDAENSRRFLQKYKKEAVVGPYIEDNRWCVEIRRRWCNAKEKLMDSLSKGLEVLRAKGIPGHIAKQLVEGFEVLDGKGIERLARRERGIAVFLKSYFSKGL
jgi:tRNA nucleotidyltransferase (CCA-adding enzyme)